MSEPTAPEGAANEVAWTAVQAAQERWPIGDPLRFVEFELQGQAPSYNPDVHHVDVEFAVKPRQTGGVRLEVFPDPFTATFLQSVADRLAEREMGLTHSLSAGMFGVRLRGEHAYDAWSAAVPVWIRRELALGRTVLVCDVKDYFPRIASEQLRAALVGQRLEAKTIEAVLTIIDEINATPDRTGAVRTGLPICPTDLFWILADLVLEPVDRMLESIEGGRHVRWVDDFFVSVEKREAASTWPRIEAAVRSAGFELNPAKSQAFGDARGFDEYSLAPAHEMLTDVAAALNARSALVAADVLLRAHSMASDEIGVEATRLVRRLYGLAMASGNRSLLPYVDRDRQRFPGAELTILRYLTHWGDPDRVLAIGEETLSSGASDGHTITLLRAWLNTSTASVPADRVVELLGRTVLTAASTVHPFATVLGLGNVALRVAPRQLEPVARGMLERIPAMPSALARRLGYEILLTVPALASASVDRIRADQSPTVRGLAALIEMSPRSPVPARLRAWLTPSERRRSSWGDLDRKLATDLLECASSRSN